jgi:drug/metabolite transporter (DMT)-like permease
VVHHGAVPAPSILLVVISLVAYQLAQRAVPAGASPWWTLTTVYLVATATSVTMAAVDGQGGRPQVLSPATLVLGFSVVGIELGYLLAFRQGVRVGTVGLIASTSAAVILSVVGARFFEEHVTWRTVVGIAACATGLLAISSET